MFISRAPLALSALLLTAGLSLSVQANQGERVQLEPFTCSLSAKHYPRTADSVVIQISAPASDHVKTADPNEDRIQSKQALISEIKFFKVGKGEGQLLKSEKKEFELLYSSNGRAPSPLRIDLTGSKILSLETVKADFMMAKVKLHLKSGSVRYDGYAWCHQPD